MDNREKDALKLLSEAYPKLTEFQKGYLLGIAESKVADKEHSVRENETRKEPVAV